ncbi:MAG: hypothetical protein A2268_02035 [Candidatus Raymondbacteria bacterium RifOxyA12_full_50_37]|uniref:Uncharacterized protein n=1 Tax=Candidatus Raymondbacteria bacterium RIFOXYD12_FULL_49_13 TaxID=1817890 RepID=A0A1F7F4L2_UNCRA|nr:MAG: hypothetical protein A2268_02035 [Candidatus Raymondbacteria bacterium RifOxyA12_full_50_37]OGJ91310.1 MAG: hypothetical protein A2350_13300 [Candidatus Raymondbacteria bacterium RifOxyB12_full_50_8]OGJ92208.1 MAG: hypothetical protein A2248_10865 [Candidatus Raymondbacteria bacterium RIFOXYA2_FULL_49_16]OGJ98534.1 MAG: hypothetical protein A2453_06665 [Candidatus Raymondbacteria bacterium RIFOXYC2_FULL_50_21]OGK01604.1 MAG: hypothetical protein A2519_06065 [Candidatus Raymondbacteria b
MTEDSDDLIDHAGTVVELAKKAQVRMIHTDEQYTASHMDNIEKLVQLNQQAAERIRQLEQEVTQLKQENEKLLGNAK